MGVIYLFWGISGSRVEAFPLRRRSTSLAAAPPLRRSGRRRGLSVALSAARGEAGAGEGRGVVGPGGLETEALGDRFFHFFRGTKGGLAPLFGGWLKGKPKGHHHFEGGGPLKKTHPGRLKLRVPDFSSIHVSKNHEIRCWLCFGWSFVD